MTYSEKTPNNNIYCLSLVNFVKSFRSNSPNSTLWWQHILNKISRYYIMETLNIFTWIKLIKPINWLDDFISVTHIHTHTSLQCRPGSHAPPYKGGPHPLRLTIRQNMEAFLYPLCLRRRCSINSCGAWVREGRPLFPFSVAWPSIQPQTAPHWLPTWRKECCLGTLPGFEKQTPLFLTLTRFSSSYFPSAAVSFFACAAPFPTMQEHFLPFCHKVDMHPTHPSTQRKPAY